MYLDTEVASVNVISQEEVSCGCRVPTDLKEFHQVVLAVDKFRNGSPGESTESEGTHVLTMDVAAN